MNRMLDTRASTFPCPKLRLEVRWGVAQAGRNLASPAGKDGAINVLHMPKVLPQRLWVPTLFLLCVWTFTAISAQTVQMRHDRIARVERVRLLSGSGVILEIAANAPVSLRTQELGGPDRLVIDVPDAIPGTGLHNLAVHRGEIRDIRVGLFSANPPITRIVVDWNSRQPYQILQSGGSAVVKMNDDGGAPVQVHRSRTASAARLFSSRVERVR